MKYAFMRMVTFMSILLSTSATAAVANNTTIEDALKSRPDLSIFYQGLVNTGVINELEQGKSYTVFAPTNEAFSKILPADYPCFYAAPCKAEATEILRNHIVPGEQHLSDMGTNVGSLMSMFTLNGHHIIASEPYKNDYAIDGNRVVSASQLPGNILYRVDGIIATKREMAQFTAAPVLMVHAKGTDLPPRVPEGVIMTISTPSPGEETAPAQMSPAR